MSVIRLEESQLIAGACFGFFLAPVDNLIGLFKGGYQFFRLWYETGSPSAYFDVNRITGLDANGRIITKIANEENQLASSTRTLSRIGGSILTGICIAGFICSLAIPIPGVAPLYAATTFAILKAAGITIGWTVVGRGIGAFCGAVVDFFRSKSFIKSEFKSINVPEQLSTKNLTKQYIKTAMSTTLFGETGIEFADQHYATRKQTSKSFNDSKSSIPTNKHDDFAADLHDKGCAAIEKKSQQKVAQNRNEVALKAEGLSSVPPAGNNVASALRTGKQVCTTRSNNAVLFPAVAAKLSKAGLPDDCKNKNEDVSKYAEVVRPISLLSK